MSNYNADSVTILSPLEAIRKRSGMYVGRTDENGLHHLMKEIVDNSVDEAMAGYCTKIIVKIHADGSLSVQDNGRGIPVGKNSEGVEVLEVMFTTTHSGGKFDNDAYENSGGLHGVGTTVVNALSLWTHITVWKHGKEFEMKFNERVTDGLKEIKSIPAKQTGTLVRFMPDPEIFTTVIWDYDRMYEILKEKAYLNKGLLIEFVDERSNDTVILQKDNGILDMMMDLTYDKKCICNPIVISENKKGVDTKLDIVLRFMNSADEVDKSFANGIPTTQGGTHVNAVRASLLEAINTIALRNKLLTKNNLLKVNDIREGLAIIIVVRYKELSFESQTKEKLAVEEIGKEARMLLENMDRDIMKIPEIVSIIERQIRLRDAKEENKKAKSIEVKSTEYFISDKLTKCESDDPSLCEIFLVEGDSAGGTAINGRDPMYQAILALKGKITNFYKAKVSIDELFKDPSVQDIVKSFGCGVGSRFDIRKLRYHKICIMTDADIDGAHIRALILAFLYKYMRPLLTGGYVYIVLAPLFNLVTTRDKRAHYAYSTPELQQLQKQLEGASYHIQRYKGLGEMDASELWETTTNPANRRLMKVVLKDDDDIEEFISNVFADDVEYRNKLIAELVNMRRRDRNNEAV